MNTQLRAEHSFQSFIFACPACRMPLDRVEEDLFHCPSDGRKYPRVHGIWNFLLPERRVSLKRFIEDYAAIRQLEGRGDQSSEYYRSLPYKDLTGRWQNDWRIRARSFDAFTSNFLVPFENQSNSPLRIIDMGAGNCWLSNRLAMRGHNVIALDLQVNNFDGLGAYIHYENRFTPVQAEFDSLPVIDRQFDLIIFNASFHYSTDYSATLRDAFLKLKEDGYVVILDTPIYQQNESGVRMVKEREAEFTSKYGFPSNSVPIQNYLTNGQIDEISSDLGISWSLIKPNYGLKWALRPWLAHLRGDREPASFSILIGGKVHQSG